MLWAIIKETICPALVWKIDFQLKNIELEKHFLLSDNLYSVYWVSYILTTSENALVQSKVKYEMKSNKIRNLVLIIVKSLFKLKLEFVVSKNKQTIKIYLYIFFCPAFCRTELNIKHKKASLPSLKILQFVSYWNIVNLSNFGKKCGICGYS